MKLNRANLYRQNSEGQVILPNEEVFSYPEKVLQFGTGVLLRGLPDYFISKANDAGIFKGRILIVKSTSQGDLDIFHEQDNLYQLATRGISKGMPVEQYRVCAAISRLLEAQEHWDQILAAACSPDLRIVISNTTEQGITYLPEVIGPKCPDSFPAKLLALLRHRYEKLGDDGSGLIILPTELITDNGDVLKEIVIRLARFNHYEDLFINWISTANLFCNTLVDRIVPGRPEPDDMSQISEKTGFEDELLINAEPYALWAIEGPAEIKSILEFHRADPRVVISPDITRQKELKLRMLNGTHTLSCALAVLSGFETVKEAMADRNFSKFIKQMMMEEISFGLSAEIDRPGIEQFGNEVIDRFRNPTIQHKWSAISANYDLKLESRVIPIIKGYFSHFGSVPSGIVFGIAAYLVWDRNNGQPDLDRETDLESLVQTKGEWGSELLALHGFREMLAMHYAHLVQSGAKKALADFLQPIGSNNETK